MPLRSTTTRRKSPGRARQKSLTRVTTTSAATNTSLLEPEFEMDFDEGSKVLARWPGTNLYYKAVVTYVRDDDNEYDVKYEDGTIFTIKARDVTKPNSFKRRTSRGRSKSKTRESKKTTTESKSETKKTTTETKSETKKREPNKARSQKSDSEGDKEDEEVMIKVLSRRKTLTKSSSAKTIPKASEMISKITSSVQNNVMKRSLLSLTDIKSKRLMDESDDEAKEEDKEISFNSSAYVKRTSYLSSLDNNTPLFSNHLKDPSDDLDGKFRRRTSARIASKLVELSSDDERPKPVSNPEIILRRSKKESFWSGWNFEWLGCLFFMVLGAFILLSLHLLCKSGSCRPAIPKLPQSLKAYLDPYCFGLIFTEIAVISILSLVPIGPSMKNVSGQSVRKNGFLTLLACLALLPALVMQQVDLKFVSKNYFRLMISSFSLGALGSLLAFGYSYLYPGSNARNSRGNTGNLIVDFFHGRERNPMLWKFDLKLQTFRFSNITLALINAVLMGDYVMMNKEASSPLVIVAAAFQILYALDALFFEDFYFFSHDAMNNGYGYSLIVSYYTLPFLPTLIVRYLLEKSPVSAPWYVIAGIVLVNMLGYMIFRSSENQRCLFKMNPEDEGIKHLDRMLASSNKKILSGSWWSLVRYPNYLGEVLIQWSWVLPAVMVAGKTDLLVYYLPMFMTLVLLVRCSEENTRNRQMYGATWDKYCQKVKSNIFPKVY
eukprot:TRINITY_DN1541_c0_g1_i2.p1 TRINITY_DN1541_c0_g1~~TRINITY_DN1541_c0_g1_i2.p1  ORF type:complete len:718 (+),score=189.24 TRINITY_DN1541_c0_g1_i2:171-2324(+)